MNKRTNKTDKVARKILPRRRLALRAFIILSICISSSLAWIHFHQNLPTPDAVATVEPPAFKQPETLNGLLALSPAELEHCDIARMNLLCAEALPGAENLNVAECLAMLDQWSQHIKAETDRNYHHFKEDPAYYSNSESFYKMLMMSVVWRGNQVMFAEARQRLARPVMLAQQQPPMNSSIPSDPNPIQQAPRNTFQTP